MLKMGNKFLTREEIKRYFGSLHQVAGLKHFTYQEGKAVGLETVGVGWSRAAFMNSKKNLGIYIYYDTRYLPHFIQWKFLEMGNYVTGLEPSNCLVEGRSKERKQRSLIYLEPGEKKVIQLEIGLLIFSEDLQQEIKNIEN
jgi:hypothetical protein